MSKWQRHDEKIVTQLHTALHNMNEGWYRETSFAREFNFAAKQVTLVTETSFVNTAKTVMAVAQQQSVQNFSDIEGKEAIIEAHGQLVALGGKPGPLQDYVSEGIGKAVPRTGLT